LSDKILFERTGDRTGGGLLH